MKRLLLLSNSTMAGSKYMEYCKDTIVNFLNASDVNEILFIPFAAVKFSWDRYTEIFETKLDKYKVTGIHQTKNYFEAINSAQSIAIGGGKISRRHLTRNISRRDSGKRNEL